MSRVEIYAVDKDGNVGSYGDAKNSWGGAIHIWDALSRKLFNKRFDLGDSNPPIWKGVESPKATPNDKIVLCSTFDGCWIKKEGDNFAKLIAAYKEFWKNHNTFQNWQGNWVDVHPTIPAMIHIFEKAEKDPDVYGLCFNATSVNQNPWWLYNWDAGPEVSQDELDEGRPVNINTDKKEVNGCDIWELFSSLTAKGHL